MARRISMSTRGELLEVVRERYEAATRTERTRILDEFTAVAGYHRKHAIRLLGAVERRQEERVGPASPGKGRARVYGPEIREALIQLWEVSDRVCGKRLRPMVRVLLPAMERHGRLELDAATRAKLLRVSAASIDRLLGEVRRLAGGGRRRPAGFGTAVRRSVPVRTFNDWRDPAPGWVEADFVTHGGTSVAGAYVQTLVLTDVATGWTECIPLVVREAEMVVHALGRARELFPFPLRGLDFDNDSLFMNEAVVGWCRAAGLEVTRSRAYRKNDQAWVEQKNGAVVRRLVGYGRFEGVLAGEALARLYAASRLHGNLFQPSFKLREKRREGARVLKRYHAPEPPVARALSHVAVSEGDKAHLRTMLANADPVLLLAEIRSAQAHLGQRVDERGAGAERIAGPAPVNIERFAASLKVAWCAGERRPTHRRRYIRRKPLVRPSIMDGVRERITAWLEVQPALTAVAILARLREADPDRFQARHERTVQRFVKLRRAAMARDVLLGGPPVPTKTELRIQPA
ncbi:transposase [Roseomonas nepalensis]|uniref:Transposase n=1 Tax=Muricoccus nepalensis TaxID=1854500 RepID=A0A502F2C7_9PROT|nr:DDE-type integrase/transposase/recombinase [Roseomonas nepalensis]TPG44318.1 transposase [Roseomonas nepalensis]